MSISYSLRFALTLTLALGGILCSVDLSAAGPPSYTQGAAVIDASKTTVRQQRFKSLDEAIARAEEELKTEHRFEVAVIVFTISTPNEQTALARTELHFVGHSSGYLPGRISTSEAVLQPVIIRRSTQPVELHIISPGFDKYIRRVILHAGALIIWDDIVLDPTSQQTAASVMGRVRLEGNEKNLEGLVISIDQEAVTFTDALGYFVADPVRAGKLSVSTHKPGYWGLRANVEVARATKRPARWLATACGTPMCAGPTNRTAHEISTEESV